jgi:predicted transcriptional regulator
VYTLRLAQQGHPIRRTLLVNVRQLLPASRVMDRRLNAVPASLTLGALVSDILPEYPSTAWFLSEKDGTVTGIASRDRVVDCFRTRGPDAAFGETAESAFVTVQEKTPLFRIIARMRDQNAGHALVASSNDTPRSAEARGVISTALLLEALTRDQTDTGG